MNEEVHELYCDGGVVGRNPSPIGGTFAWCLVDAGERVAERVGGLLPSDMGVLHVSNNNSELTALLDGLENLPAGWDGRVNSDSQVALGWVFLGWSQEKVPAPLRERLNAMRQSGRLAGLRWRLLQGHPTKADLACGIGKKRTLPVSEHNVYVDQACQAHAKAMLDDPFCEQ